MKLRRSVILVAAATAATALTPPADSMTILPKATTTNDHVVVVGLNGALQKRFILPHRQALVPGNVHRAESVDFGVGGKGQDVAIALHCLLEESPIRLLQFLGNGFAGDTVHNLLRERLGDTAMGLTVRTISELRTCTSIIASDETTELVEPSGMIASDELDQLFSLLSSSSGTASTTTATTTDTTTTTTASTTTTTTTSTTTATTTTTTTARALCIMGSMPPGCPEDTYAKIHAQVGGKDTVCVVDSLAGIMPLLRTISQNKDRVGPLVLKVNASELCKLAGTSKRSSEIGGITLDELTGAIDNFFFKFPTAMYETATKSDGDDSSSIMTKSYTGVIGLAVTDGKHDAYFVGIQKNHNNGEGIDEHTDGGPFLVPSFRVFKLPVPKLDTNQSSRPLYPIGAGDAVAAGMVGAWATLAATKTVANTPSFSPLLPANSLELLEEFAKGVYENKDSISKVHADAASAFAFGLACGSASCLQEENSVLDLTDVNASFQSMMTTRLQQVNSS